MNITISLLKSDPPKDLGDFIFKASRSTEIESLGLKNTPYAIAKNFQLYMTDDDKVVFLAKDGDKVIGCFFGHLRVYPFTEDILAMDQFWHVLPEYQGQGIGKQLMFKFAVWAKEKGAKLIIQGVSEIVGQTRHNAIKSLESQGFSLFSRMYCMGVDECLAAALVEDPLQQK